MEKPEAKKEKMDAGRGKVKVWEWVLCLLLVVLSVWFKPLYMYFANAEEAVFSEILPLMGGFAAGAAAVFLLTALLTRSVWGSAVFAAVAALAATNFTALESLFHLLPLHIRYWHVAAVLVFILAHLAYLFTKKLPAELIRTVGGVLTLVFGVLIVINGATAAPTLIKRATAAPVKTTETSTDGQTNIETAEKMPNVYFFIYDEFAPEPTMEKYYGYSCDFFDQLEDLGFTISYDSHNMSYGTVTVTTNYMNFDYIVSDANTTQERVEARKNNATRDLFGQHGYTCRSILSDRSATEWGIGENLAQAGTITASTVGGKSLADLLLEDSFLYPTINDAKAGEQLADILNQGFAFFEDPSNYTPSNTYTLSYACTPHEPFIFNADGTLNKPRYFHEWIDPRYYLHQWQYVSGKVLETMKNVVKNDPDSIIILMSDHSARWAPGIVEEDKTNILNAVYYLGEPMDDFCGKSGVNTLRTVYSKLLGVELPDVEVFE